MQVGVFRAEKNQLGARRSLCPRARARSATPGSSSSVTARCGPTWNARPRSSGPLNGRTSCGLRGDVPALLSLADVMLSPSITDAMPMTILEAMALGVPVLATDVGDVCRVLGDAGICVPVGDEKALEQACVRLLSDPDARARMGRVGPERAREFSATTMSRRYEALFEAAATGHPPLAAIAAFD